MNKQEQIKALQEDWNSNSDGRALKDHIPLKRLSNFDLL